MWGYGTTKQRTIIVKLVWSSLGESYYDVGIFQGWVTVILEREDSEIQYLLLSISTKGSQKMAQATWLEVGISLSVLINNCRTIPEPRPFSKISSRT